MSAHEQFVVYQNKYSNQFRWNHAISYHVVFYIALIWLNWFFGTWCWYLKSGRKVAVGQSIEGTIRSGGGEEGSQGHVGPTVVLRVAFAHPA